MDGGGFGLLSLFSAGLTFFCLWTLESIGHWIAFISDTIEYGSSPRWEMHNPGCATVAENNIDLAESCTMCRDADAVQPDGGY